jgi:hypothetical protein
MFSNNIDVCKLSVARVFLYKLSLLKRLSVMVVALSAACFSAAFAEGVASKVVAVPDDGKSDCISFKLSADTNPLLYSFGYACVSESYCEVFDHGCDGNTCESVDYSKGTRTTLTAVPMLTGLSDVLMAPAGVSLRDKRANWCLVQDGAGNFWALDKWRGSSEQFMAENLDQTVIRCKPTDLFSNETGCVSR